MMMRHLSKGDSGMLQYPWAKVTLKDDAVVTKVVS